MKEIFNLIPGCRIMSFVVHAGDKGAVNDDENSAGIEAKTLGKMIRVFTRRRKSLGKTFRVITRKAKSLGKTFRVITRRRKSLGKMLRVITRKAKSIVKKFIEINTKSI
ncbi:MAG: hypothetical protein LBI96_03930 [Odoribacteraceae bacterium]|nr:hypothetical protein [Odoribacteraceae bacterium]